MYFYIFLRLKFGSDTEFVTNLIENKVIIGGISSDVDFFEDSIAVTFSADVLDKSKFIFSLQNELNVEGLDEYRFELIVKALKVSELSKMDYIYANIIRFATGIDFSEKLYSIDSIDKIEFEDMKKFIANLDFGMKTVTYVRKKKWIRS